MHKYRLALFGGIFVVALVSGVLGFMRLEHLSLLDSLYFTCMTITTVGYGDIHPTTDGGKLLAMAVVFAGVGTFVMAIESAAEYFFDLRERNERREKRNMIRGVFFSDLGLALLRQLAPADAAAGDLTGKLHVDANWSPEHFREIRSFLDGHAFDLNIETVDLTAVREVLMRKADLLLRLLENPSVIEAEAFTDMLRAIFHLRDELGGRPADLRTLPASDLKHLGVDVKRAYGLLTRQWLLYVEYLKVSYPYLFYLAVRANPFDPKASLVVTE